jgi:hypothetical protein
VAAVVGLPLGIVAGRVTWTGFATSLGVVPVTVAPLVPLVLGLVLLVTAGALLAMLPRFFSQNSNTTSLLRAE